MISATSDQLASRSARELRPNSILVPRDFNALSE